MGANSITSGTDILSAILDSERAPVLAVITETTGPSYRLPGAMMLVYSEGEWLGSLSSGCIEKDIALNAVYAQKTGQPRSVLYGVGSPFIDMNLPCGGSINVLLLPSIDREVIQAAVERADARQSSQLCINVQTGEMRLGEATGRTVRDGDILNVSIAPKLQFAIFGNGAECISFSQLARSLNFDCRVYATEDSTLSTCASLGCRAEPLPAKVTKSSFETDAMTAVVLFFHDHDREPEIIASFEDRESLYLGALGSSRARETRDDALIRLGCDADFVADVRGPIGVTRSSRDPLTLSVSVLAEILDLANN